MSISDRMNYMRFVCFLTFCIRSTEPLIKEMDGENKRMAATILMLPRDVLFELPGIDKLVDEMLIVATGSASTR